MKQAAPPDGQGAVSPDSTLAAWTVLEVLSPQTFRRDEDVAGGDRRLVGDFRNGLPWERPVNRKGYRLYHQLVLGSVKLPEAFEALVEVWGDNRPERRHGSGEAILASLTLDRNGVPVENGCASLSSFAWALPMALTRNLAGLGWWSAEEPKLLAEIENRLRPPDEDGSPARLDRTAIDALYGWLVDRLGLEGRFLRPPRFAVRAYRWDGDVDDDPPDPLVLNSFYLADLERARQLFRSGRAPRTLRLYLGRDTPGQRTDLLNNREALRRAVAPHRLPLARWPGRGRPSLSLLQQAAVNLSQDELTDDGILAVNGPPGTGKTTLLRDVVAAVVTARAQAMATFDEPALAFQVSGQVIAAGPARWQLHRVDPILTGHEILVASSNNKAVENVSAELPIASAVAEDVPELRYFRTLSDALHNRETWGLAAAVLGNMKNRSAFRKTFWWDADVGLQTYLQAAGGFVKLITVPASDDSRPPKIVSQESAPRDTKEALQRWSIARKNFNSALHRAKAQRDDLAKAQALAEKIISLRNDIADARGRLAAADEAMRFAAATHDDEVRVRDERALSLEFARQAMAKIAANRPGLFSRLIRRRKYREWTRRWKASQRSVFEAERAHARSTPTVKLADESLVRVRGVHANASSELARYERYRTILQIKLDQWRPGILAHLIDERFENADDATRQLTSPWFDDAANRVRDDVFIAAIALHKAFVDAAAKPLRHNLAALMEVLAGRPMPDAAREALVVELWRSLFLVVPVISTTFASVHRMIGGLPARSFGWLLVDEAGQARPQEVIGALTRSQRAVVVGDPVQLEPIVALPDVLTRAICREFGVADRFNAPAASVQTLADAATQYFATFEGRTGSRTVGVPLLVHRRCAEPMFGIANDIAYDGKMVCATPSRGSAVRDVLGPSRWIEVEGWADGKWSAAEGNVVVEMLRTLEASDIALDLYIITPFVAVQNGLRRLVRESGLPISESKPDDWVKARIGTIHTVQGREADAVILVLGAPGTREAGARNWAGGTPNLLNVAVTRAKEALYVVGGRSAWRNAGVFKDLDRRLGT